MMMITWFFFILSERDREGEQGKKYYFTLLFHACDIFYNRLWNCSERWTDVNMNRTFLCFFGDNRACHREKQWVRLRLSVVLLQSSVCPAWAANQRRTHHQLIRANQEANLCVCSSSPNMCFHPSRLHHNRRVFKLTGSVAFPKASFSGFL